MWVLLLLGRRSCIPCTRVIREGVKSVDWIDVFLTLLGIGLIIFVFLFVWLTYMLDKIDNMLREFLEHKERFDKEWLKYKGEL